MALLLIDIAPIFIVIRQRNVLHVIKSVNLGLKMDPAELEFIGENESIGIIPNFILDNAIHLISGSIGPFRAGLPVHGEYIQ